MSVNDDPAAGRAEHERSRRDVDALAQRLGEALAARGLVAVTAESCTAGLVAGAITSVAGSSAWFDRGFVTYSNAAKAAMLGVPAALIESQGAVSEAVARAMAEGALSRSDAHLSVAITGIAGPAGGSAAKPVGTVCFAFVRRGDAARARTERLPGTRADVRERSVVIALEGLLALAGA